MQAISQGIEEDCIRKKGTHLPARPLEQRCSAHALVELSSYIFYLFFFYRIYNYHFFYSLDWVHQKNIYI